MSRVPPTPHRANSTPPTVPGQPLAPSGSDSTDRACVVCAYSLRGLDPADSCPECGTSVARSLHGNLLKNAPPNYLAKLHRGTLLIMAGLTLDIPLAFGAFFVGAHPMDPLVAVVSDFGLVNSALSLYGWWPLSELDPGYAAHDTGTTPRTIIRSAVLVTTAATAVSIFASFLSPNSRPVPLLAPFTVVNNILFLVLLIASAAQYFASMRYIQWLALRLPSDTVLTRAKLLAWLGPILMTVGCLALLLGPLAAFILYWDMLNRVRKDLNRVAVESEALRVPPYR